MSPALLLHLSALYCRIMLHPGHAPRPLLTHIHHPSFHTRTPYSANASARLSLRAWRLFLPSHVHPSSPHHHNCPHPGLLQTLNSTHLLWVLGVHALHKNFKSAVQEALRTFRRHLHHHPVQPARRSAGRAWGHSARPHAAQFNAHTPRLQQQVACPLSTHKD